jgi:hypothetical protein
MIGVVSRKGEEGLGMNKNTQMYIFYLTFLFNCYAQMGERKKIY